MGSSGSSGFGCEQVALHIMDPWNLKPWKLSWHLSGGFLGKRVGCDDNFHEHHYVFRKYRKSSVFSANKNAGLVNHMLYTQLMIDRWSLLALKGIRSKLWLEGIKDFWGVGKDTGIFMWPRVSGQRGMMQIELVGWSYASYQRPKAGKPWKAHWYT